ncbi:Ferrichrome-iron receptor precursor [Lacunisphaera limnophila]|uniref:Ferrichrome-iron receptor n=1 Tax=Lacunisphaera limnophila TaxID=1838286 RepID=A0A1D8ATY8_9BACT|nr:TonB-dependent receptor plug domain-containing protein [Lacunisphaera limnophila]AOS44354.1 Ferrichrome-iron receptor precursor [Lacunisphaera limnophila]
MNHRPRSASFAGFLIGAAALSLWPLAALAQQTTAPSTTEDETVVLSPFTVTSDKDDGYGATNSISASRVNTPIKDIPVPILVITDQFINDIGATTLRDSLSYVSGISLQTQNDLENRGGTFGSAYGPGGVNNPEGVTSNINGVQMKIRGFITNNVLRDGYYRGSPSDSINIERIEVVQGPNALLYGTGNFGGVVNYLTKKPLNEERATASVSYGTNSFMRATIDSTGPISSTVAYRVVGAWEDTETNIDHQSMKHWYISPSLSWRPTRKTEILAQYEYNDAENRGFGFRALRAAQGTGATPINNDQLEATGFYWPPGANKRTHNLGGPDIYNLNQQDNTEVTLTQQIVDESTWMPRVDFLAGYNRSTFNTQTRDANGGIQQVSVGNPGFNLSQTITLTSIDNGLGGSTPSNGNLQYGTFDNEVTRFSWNRNDTGTTRSQVRAELTARKALFEGRWFQLEDQVLAGYTKIANKVSSENWETAPGLYSYKGPLDLTPIRFATQGDGSPAPGLFQNNRDNINKGWDRALYLNNYLKFGKLGGLSDRIILMTGIREDKANNWSTNTQVTIAGVPTTSTSRALESKVKSRQNGVMLKLTNSLSVYALKADGFQPNFGGLHEAMTGAPVGADTAKSKELGLKFDFMDGKISGTISRYKITKNAWISSGFSTPAPLGAPRFDPTKPIIYNLGDANGTGFQPFPGFVSNGQTYTPNAAQQAAWSAAVAAGAVTLVSPINGRAADSGSIYLNASTPQGAAWMDAFFAAAAPGWAGWPYKGNDMNDPGINNATLDDAAFQNGPQQAAIPAISQSEGWDGSFLFTPTKQLQIVLTASIGTQVQLIDKGKWIKYPYPQDRWATWYFPNGGFGLKGQKLNEAYTDPTDTSTRTNTGTFPGDDTPEDRFSIFANYKFEGDLKGWIVGAGGDWQSKRAYFSGVTHGSGQVQTDAAGEVIVLYTPKQWVLNAFVRREWKKDRYNQSVQLNIDNVINDEDLYGTIYAPGLSARLTYTIGY